MKIIKSTTPRNLLPEPPTPDLTLSAEEIHLGQTRMLIALGFTEDEAAECIKRHARRATRKEVRLN